MDKIYQQGDVILVKRDKLPQQTKLLQHNGRWILAEGEHTGHAHVITDTASVKLREDSAGTVWVSVEDDAVLTHEEHAAQTIAPGVYEIRRVVEVDPFSNEVREVQD